MQKTRKLSMKQSGSASLSRQIVIALLISLALFVITVAINPKSLNKNAFGQILSNTIMLTLASSGQTMVMITGGIDMSIGATMSLAGIVTAGIMKGQDGFFPMAIILSIAIGLIAGVINGTGAVKLGLPPMIVTMCVSNVVTRLQYVVTSGKPSGQAATWLAKSMTYRIGGVVPSSIFYLIVIFALVVFLLNFSRYGQQLFLTGNNERAAFLNGIRTTKVQIITYALSGLMAGIAGFLGAGYMNSTLKGSTFDHYTMTSIIAVVVGGTLLTGGKGSYVGTLSGALLITVLTNGLAVLNVSSATTDMIMGLVLILLLTAYNRAKPVRQ